MNETVERVALEPALQCWKDAGEAYAKWMGDPEGNDDWRSANEDAAKVIEAFASRRAAIAAMGGGWQPIETAPKDGTWVLLFGPNGVDLGAYEPDFIDQRWQRKLTAEYDNEGAEITAPTHWQPLPTPPETDHE